MIDLGFEEVVNAILDAIPTSNLKSDDEALALQQVRFRQSFFVPRQTAGIIVVSVLLLISGVAGNAG